MIIVIGGTSGLWKAITDYLRSIENTAITLSRREQPDDQKHITCIIADYQSLKKVFIKLSKINSCIGALVNCAEIASMNLAITTPRISFIL